MESKVTVADLRETVITDNIAVKDEKGVYRLKNGKIVSKATKAELLDAINTDKPATVETAPLPTLHHKDGPINNSPDRSLAEQIARCYQKAGEYEAKIHLHPRNRRRANYWTKQAKKLERKAA